MSSLPHAPLTHPQYRADIDGLRAIAVLSVLVFHAFPSSLRGGFIGVDIFFVISGYLISTIIFNNLQADSFSFLEFYRRRVRRIFPALSAVLVACFGFGWFALLGDEFQQLGKHIAAGAGFVSNFALWGESGYFDNVSDTKPLLHLWSLGIEEQFYIVWPLLVWFFWRFKRGMGLLLAAVGVASFLWNVFEIHNDRTAAFYAPYTRFWELLIGSALAYLVTHKVALPAFLMRWPIKQLRNVASCLGLLLLVAGLLFITKKQLFPGWWALMPTVGAALLIAAGPLAVVNRLLLAKPVVVWFGLISFPLYLWHWPLLSFAHIVEGQTPAPMVRLMALGLSVLLAWLTYRFIERPLRFGAHAQRKAAGLILAMLLIGGTGYATYAAQGFPSRQNVSMFKNNQNELQRTPAQDAACLSYIGQTKPSFDYCRFSSRNSKETVAVIGDSHAHVAYPGIAHLAAEQGMNAVLLANSGCPTFLGAAYGKNTTEIKFCERRIHEALDTIKTKQDIQKIFIVARGSFYLTGKYFGEAEKEDNPGPLIPAEIYLSSLQRTIDSLRQTGKDVYVVAENPELLIHPSGCIPRPLRLTAHSCDVAYDVVRQRQAQYLDILGKLRGTEVIYTLEAFCEGGVCHALHNGDLLYADFDHLSVKGSFYLADRLLRQHVFSK